MSLTSPEHRTLEDLRNQEARFKQYIKKTSHPSLRKTYEDCLRTIRVDIRELERKNEGYTRNG